jgi:hypothetical protein
MRCPVRRLLRRRFASQRHGLVRCHVRVIRLRWPHVDRFRRRMSCGETSEIFDLPLRSAGMVVGHAKQATALLYPASLIASIERWVVP